MPETLESLARWFHAPLNAYTYDFDGWYLEFKRRQMEAGDVSLEQITAKIAELFGKECSICHSYFLPGQFVEDMGICPRDRGIFEDPIYAPPF